MKLLTVKHSLASLAGVIALSSLPSLHALEITNPEPNPGDSFGWSLGVSGDTTIVGAFRSGTGGVVYVLDADSGEIRHRLVSDDREENDMFGFWSAISGNHVVVSTPAKTVDGKASAGAAYLFDAATGQQTYKLTASDAQAGDSFGWTSAILGNLVVVAAPNANGGAAYLFDATTGAQTHKLTAADVELGDFFGASASINNNTVLIGASSKSNGGAAYLFDGTTGAQMHKLTADDAQSGDNFGWSSAIDANMAIVGANKKSIDGKATAGAAYLYDASTGQQLHKLTADDAAASDEFGYAVDISGNTAIVGASMKTENGIFNSGAAYLFDTGSGEQLVKLRASNGALLDRFGSCVSVDGDNFAVAPYGPDGGKSIYLGSVQSLTTLDAGNTKKTISGISFESKTDWIIGQSTSGNTVILSAGDSADILETGKAVYIGKNSNSNGNTLEISGTLAANEVYIGSVDQNFGNLLQLNSDADYSLLAAIYLTEGNALAFEQNWLSEDELFDFLGTTELYAYDASRSDSWVAMNESNYLDWLMITDTADDGMLVRIKPQPIPEPSSYAAFVGLMALFYRNRRQKKT